MDLHEQSYFVAIAESGSLSRAAARLNISQSALSQYLARLEQKLGSVLICRSRTADMVLTEAGNEYLECCRAILGQWQRTRENLISMREGRTQQLTVGLSSTYGAIKLFRCVAQVREKYPDFQLKMVEWPALQWPEKLLHGEVHLVFASHLSEHPQINYRNFAERKVVLAVKKENPLARFSYRIPGQEDLKIPIGAVGDTPLVLMNPDTVFGIMAQEWMTKKGFVPHAAAYVGHLDLMIDMVSECNLACLIGSGGHRMNSHEDILPVALEDTFTYRSSIMYRKDALITPAMEALMDRYIDMTVNTETV